MGIEGEHGAGPADHLAMAAVHATWLQELFGDLSREALDDAVGGMHALRNVVRGRLAPSDEQPASRKRRTRATGKTA